MLLGSLLIVDDEPGITHILNLLLKKHISQIKVASNGREALELVKAEHFDAVVTDINMPEMNGLDFLANVRYLGLETPFVILTAFADKENTREALRLGATDFVDKPFEPENIISILRKTVELGQLQKMIEAETEQMYNSSNLPADAKIRLRKIKQSIMMLKASYSIYKR